MLTAPTKIILKIWQIIIFLFFFTFIGKFAAIYWANSLELKYIFELISSIIFILFIFIFVKDLNKFSAFKPQTKWLQSIVVGLLCGLFFWMSKILYNPILELSLANCNLDLCSNFKEDISSNRSTFQYDRISWLLMVLLFIQISIIGPIREELVYRVTMLLSLSSRYSLLKSSLIIAIIFAFMHLQNWLPAFLTSFTLSALVIHYKNTIAAVVAHGSYNTFIYFLWQPVTIFPNYTAISYIEITLYILITLKTVFWSVYFINKSTLNDVAVISTTSH